MKPPPKLPEDLLAARRHYVQCKIDAGYCADLTCASLREPGKVRCARCLARIAASDDRRQRNRNR